VSHQSCILRTTSTNPDEAALFNDFVPNITDLKVTQFEVKPSTKGNTVRTRFRFINMSAFSQFFVRFEQHKVTTVEVDGVLINPDGQGTDGFTVAPGQRVSVVLESMTNPDPQNGYRILVALGKSQILVTLVHLQKELTRPRPFPGTRE